MTPAGRAFWVRQLHLWHWVSAAISLVGMLAFAVTGVTLNHAADIPTKPKITTLEAVVPQALRDELAAAAGGANRPLPADLQRWLLDELSLRVGERAAEWSDEEIYLALPRPGGDAWLSVDLASGETMYEETSRGWVSYFNDLHKGRSTGVAWAWYIDIFAAACVVFSITGLVLLQLHASRRPSTWPMVGLGFLGPLLLIILFVH